MCRRSPLGSSPGLRLLRVLVLLRVQEVAECVVLQGAVQALQLRHKPALIPLVLLQQAQASLVLFLLLLCAIVLLALFAHLAHLSRVVCILGWLAAYSHGYDVARHAQATGTAFGHV